MISSDDCKKAIVQWVRGHPGYVRSQFDGAALEAPAQEEPPMTCEEYDAAEAAVQLFIETPTKRNELKALIASHPVFKGPIVSKKDAAKLRQLKAMLVVCGSLLDETSTSMPAENRAHILVKLRERRPH